MAAVEGGFPEAGLCAGAGLVEAGLRCEQDTALQAQYGRRVPAIESAAVTGTLPECLAGVRDVIAAGAELILFTPLYDVHEHMERIAAELIPELT